MAIRRLVGMLAVSLFCLTGAAQTAHDINNEGVVLYNAGQFIDAARVFEQAYQQMPDHPTVRRNLCNARQGAANELAKVADFAGAARLLEAAIAVDPENASPYIQLGSYYLRLDMVPEAIQRLEEAIRLEPRSVDAHELLGDAYYMDNDIPSARIQWEWVAQVQPNRPGLDKKLEKAQREHAVEADYYASGSRHFQLTSTPQVPGRTLRRIQSVLERAYAEIGRNLGGIFPPTPVQVIVYDSSGFTDATLAPGHVGAIFDGKIRIPATGAEGALLDEQDLQQRLYHEYTHVVVRFLTGANVPWWLNEGLAETFSRDLTPGQLAALEKANAETSLFPLSTLEDARAMASSDEAALRLAYAEAHATVRYLWSRFGQGRMADMLSALAAGIPAEEALQQSYNRTYDSLQKEVGRTFGQAAQPDSRN